MPKIKRQSKCIEFQGYKMPSGYGVYYTKKNRKKLAHRVAYEENYGPIPSGLCVCHKCDNPPCINPRHLFLGTQADNIKDKVNKNRQSRVFGELHGRAKLTNDQIKEIRTLYTPYGYMNQRRLAKRFGVCREYISVILLNKCRKDV